MGFQDIICVTLPVATACLCFELGWQSCERCREKALRKMQKDLKSSNDELQESVEQNKPKE